MKLTSYTKCKSIAPIFKYFCSVSGQHSVNIQDKYKIANAYNHIKRLEEEETLLLKEMANYIRFFRYDRSERLKHDISGIKM